MMGWRSIAALTLLAVACSSVATGEIPDEADPNGDAIVNGSPATAEQFYSTVVFTDDDGTTCTGTLIAPTIVLSAAHCFTDEDTLELEATDGTTVSYGVKNIEDIRDEERVAIDSVVIRDYQDDCQGGRAPGLCRSNDIAVVLLDRAITNAPIAPILSGAETRAALKSVTPIIVSGYGLIAPADEESNGTLHIGTTLATGEISSTEFAAGRSGQPDTCQGDSGGPAYLRRDGRLYLVGVTSRGRNDANGECGKGGIYTIAGAYTDWISTASNGAYPPSPCARLRQLGDDECSGEEDDTLDPVSGGGCTAGAAPGKSEGSMPRGYGLLLASAALMIGARRRKR